MVGNAFLVLSKTEQRFGLRSCECRPAGLRVQDTKQVSKRKNELKKINHACWHHAVSQKTVVGDLFMYFFKRAEQPELVVDAETERRQLLIFRATESLSPPLLSHIKGAEQLCVEMCVCMCDSEKTPHLVPPPFEAQSVHCTSAERSTTREKLRGTKATQHPDTRHLPADSCCWPVTAGEQLQNGHSPPPRPSSRLGSGITPQSAGRRKSRCAEMESRT